LADGLKNNLSRIIGASALVIVLSWALRGTEFEGSRLLSGIPRGVQFVREMFPPDVKVLPKALSELVVTIQMAILATFISFVFAVPVSFVAARTVVVPRWISASVKYALNVFRAVPSFVYAILFVYMVGLGPFTGALGIAVGSFVFLAKLFAEALESVHPAPIEAVKAVGGNSPQVFVYGMLPQALPQFLSHTLYAWELNIGSATIVGIVGAGGIGQQMIEHIRYFQWPQACTYVLVLVAMVLVADAVSFQVRRRYT
jgi:phosphonate transport system permease protein